MASIGAGILVLLDALSLAAGVWALALSVPGGPTLDIEGVISSRGPLNPGIAFFFVQASLLWFLPLRRALLHRTVAKVATVVGLTGRRGEAGKMTTVTMVVGTALTLAYVVGAVESYGRPVIAGDGLGHYAYLRSLWIDRDLDFANEFWDYREQYALPNPNRKTATGLVANPWPVGPAVLWAPAFAVAHHVADPLQGQARDGYSRPYHRAVVFASVTYGLLGLLLTYLCARQVASVGAAFMATMALFWCTAALFYVTGDPALAHSLSIFSVGLCVFLWLRWRRSTTTAHYVILGVAVGLCALVRFQDGVILLLPAFSLLTLRCAWQRRLWLAGWLGGGLAVALLPQVWALRQIYGRWLLVPQGGAFLRFWDPSVLDVLFSWHHGFVSWTPLAGLLLLTSFVFAYRKPALGLPLLAFVTVEIYVAAAALDWWGGAAFGARRLVSLTTPLAMAFAAVLSKSGPRPWGVLVVVSMLLGFTNVAFVESYRLGLIANEAPVNLLTEAPRVLGARIGVGGATSDAIVFSATDAKRLILFSCAVFFCFAYRRSELTRHDPRSLSQVGA